MKTHRSWTIIGMLAIVAMVLAFAAPFQHAAQAADEGPRPSASLRVIYPVKAGVTTASLGVLAQKPVGGAPTAGIMALREKINQVLPKALSTAGQSASTDSSIVQSTAPVGVKAMPSPLTSFDGNNNVYGVLPPDTNGDIGYDPGTGTKYYFQTVNLHFSIWNVTDPTSPSVLVNAAANNSLWSGFGGICESNNDGDPIVLFDHLSQRWLFSQFALDMGTPEFHQCIAVSKTADPTGEWYLYDYLISDHNLNDYPKFGVWPDAYYMTVNQFDANNNYAWAGAGVAAFDRAAMLAGDPNAVMVYIDTGTVTTDYGGMLPADLDGTAPPNGTPGYFIEWDDSTWLGDPADTLRIWEFHVDWNAPANSTFGADANYTPNATVQTADVDPDMCGFDRNCIPQPGGTAVDAISDRLMYRAAFRVLSDGSFTLLSNHTVDADGSDHAGIHWFELRYDGSSWSMHQEGVYAPDSENRWMGSVAMDHVGDIALGYSLSSTSTYPSVRYAGRLSGDPLGEMTQGEETLVAGGGSQSHSSGRWGDYSMMSVDPLDDCTFWYTQEYYSTDSSADWNTRIGAFVFPSCAAGATGSLEGTVTDNATGDPIANAKVTASDGVNSYETYTNDQGQYSFATLPVGTYDVTAEAWGYSSSTVNNVTITADATTQQDFALSPVPMTTITFEVKDSQTNWPLYAVITVDGTPYTALYTDPTTGTATGEFPQGNYHVTVTSIWPGYLVNHHTLTVTDTDATDAVLLDANLATCTAPGYEFQSGFSEDFENGVPPMGWAVVDNVAGGGLDWMSNTDYGDGNYTGGQGLSADVNSDLNKHVPYDTELITPSIDVAALPAKMLTYLANYQQYSADEAFDLDISTDGGITWTNILQWKEDHGTIYGTPGEKVSVDLSSYLSGATSFQLRWHYYTSESSPWNWYAQIDQVEIGGCAPAADGLVFGAVVDANSGNYFSGSEASVTDGAHDAQWVSVSQDPNTPPYLYVLGEPAGGVSLTASGPAGYHNDTEAVSVASASAVRQDFNLTAAHLTLAPGEQSFAVYPSQPTTSGSATLGNVGTAGTDYQVFAVKGPVPHFTPLSPEALEQGLDLDGLSKAELSALFDENAQNAGAFAMPVGEKAPVAMTNAGNVVADWEATGLTYAWGLGVERTAGNLWVGDLAAAGAPSNTDYEFQPDGTSTGMSIDLPWVGVFAADMAYDPFTGMLWQINVGGDFCIYELNPVNMTSTGRKICPDPALSLRGLAFDPLTNTFIAGTWGYGGYVFRIGMDGQYYEMKQINLPISGLAFNPSTGHLFALINADTSNTGAFDVYVLDPAQDYAIIGAFNLMENGTPLYGDSYGQAGLGVSCDGTLWAVDQSQNKVYGFESGETGWCDFTASWLTVTPDSGLLAAGDEVPLALGIDMTGLPSGPYDAHLQGTAITPYQDPMSGVHVDVLANNDAVEGAVALDIPSSTVVDTSGYTFRSDDPVPSCAGARTGATAWYTVTSTEDRYVGLDTFLSDYDTVIGVFSGSPGAFSEVACNDDAVGAQSHLGFQATAGTTYYIMVGAKNEGAGGELHLHVSSFTDVPGNLWAWTYIEALRQVGISGYPDGTYRPANSVTRAQIAKFVLLAKHGAGYTPPSFASYSFSDIEGLWAADWIEEAYQEGIVGGYSDGTYRPNNFVTRAQMVKFVLLGKHGAGYTPPSFSSYSFSDIEGLWAADWIEEAYQEGIVGGYPDGTYRPNNHVTRAQMAKFLVNAFSLTLPSLAP